MLLKEMPEYKEIARLLKLPMENGEVLPPMSPLKEFIWWIKKWWDGRCPLD